MVAAVSRQVRRQDLSDDEDYDGEVDNDQEEQSKFSIDKY